MLTTGLFPDKLKIAEVIPLFKKGDKYIFELKAHFSITRQTDRQTDRQIFY